MRKRLLYFLAILFAFSGCKDIGRFLPFSKRKLAFLFPKKKETPAIQDLNLAEAIIWSEPVKISLERDPFRPLIGKFFEAEEIAIEEELDLKLVGIFFSTTPLALIKAPQQTYIVRVKDKIGKVEVEKIDKDKVVLNKRGKKIILKMEVKK